MTNENKIDVNEKTYKNNVDCNTRVLYFHKLIEKYRNDTINLKIKSYYIYFPLQRTKTKYKINS